VREKAQVWRDPFETQRVAETTAAISAALKPELLERARLAGCGLSLSDALALARRVSSPVPV
jgi:hypothetical protein